jgi:hypothetical protein
VLSCPYLPSVALESNVRTSLFKIVKIGTASSSWPTVGPMRVSDDFVSEIVCKGLRMTTRRGQIDLYGSLALTGRRHGTDHAAILGLVARHEVPSLCREFRQPRCQRKEVVTNWYDSALSPVYLDIAMVATCAQFRG